jgi:hypothetical protein
MGRPKRDRVVVEGTVQWMLPQLCERHGLSIAGLVARLHDVGYDISVPQAYRLRDPGPVRFCLLLTALCAAMDCKPVDLLYAVPVSVSTTPPLPRFRLPGT